MYITRSSAVGLFGCSHNLVIVSSAAMNRDVHTSLRVSVSLYSSDTDIGVYIW